MVVMSTLDSRRASFTRLLTVPCTVWRDGRDAYGAHTQNKDVLVGTTLCGISALGGSGTHMLSGSMVKNMSILPPGARTLSFAWDEDLKSQDEVRVGSDTFINGGYFTPDPTVGDAKYTLKEVYKDDPARVGIQVMGDLVLTK